MLFCYPFFFIFIGNGFGFKELYNLAQLSYGIIHHCTGDSFVHTVVHIALIGIWNICGEGEVINTATRKNKRRMGVATRLLNEAFSFCREKGIKTLHLEVRETNTPAICLYKKLGFIKDGERKNYYDGNSC